MALEAAVAYTFPEERGVCGFCGDAEGGYAKRKDGQWQAACWKCVKPETAGATQSKRKLVGTIYTDVDADVVEPATKKKNPGMAPSTNRPRTA
jgi:hypothetical protein